MDQKKIGRFLKELRKEKDITQEQLAEKIKVSGRMGKVLIWFVIIISTVVIYCLMKVKAESDELYLDKVFMMKTVYHMRSCIENTVQLRNAVFFGALMRRKQVYDEFKSFFVYDKRQIAYLPHNAV